MKRPLRCVVFLSLFFCALLEAADIDQRIKNRAHAAVQVCIDKFAEVTGENLNVEIDRAYVIVADDKVEVLFARGENGAFGKRSDSFESFLACGVLDAGPSTTIYALEIPFRKTIVARNKEVRQITESSCAQAPWELLYRRHGNKEFRFQRARKFEEHNENPETVR